MARTKKNPKPKKRHMVGTIRTVDVGEDTLTVQLLYSGRVIHEVTYTWDPDEGFVAGTNAYDKIPAAIAQEMDAQASYGSHGTDRKVEINPTMARAKKNPSKYIKLEHLGDQNEHLWPADALAIPATGRRGVEIDLPDNTLPSGAAPLRTFARDQIVYVQSIDTGEKPGTKIWYRMSVLGPPQSNPRSNPRAKKNPKAKRNPSEGWDVFLRGKKIDTIFYSGKNTADDIKRSLVNHDGYDSEIIVRRSRKNPKANPKAKKAEFPYRKQDDAALKDGAQVARARYYSSVRSTAKDILEETKGDDEDTDQRSGGQRGDLHT